MFFDIPIHPVVVVLYALTTLVTAGLQIAYVQRRVDTNLTVTIHRERSIEVRPYQVMSRSWMLSIVQIIISILSLAIAIFGLIYSDILPYTSIMGAASIVITLITAAWHSTRAGKINIRVALTVFCMIGHFFCSIALALTAFISMMS
ncbi:hypothetical protein KC909_04270 [Candidatus Dojkabacteria bacterium]|uniref:Uncharacterized protein n=1 Tax=Candidatus Dojkabacteria bacterium TaxID=2099670 RepID=A0A955L5T3_9BACT|nr:hypothetical protein [Candidatus Dojkabacteria bacterium]